MSRGVGIASPNLGHAADIRFLRRQFPFQRLVHFVHGDKFPAEVIESVRSLFESELVLKIDNRAFPIRILGNAAYGYFIDIILCISPAVGKRNRDTIETAVLFHLEIFSVQSHRFGRSVFVRQPFHLLAAL